MPRPTNVDPNAPVGQVGQNFNPNVTLQPNSFTGSTEAVSTQPTAGQKLMEAVGMALPDVQKLATWASDNQKQADQEQALKDAILKPTTDPVFTNNEASWYRDTAYKVATDNVSIQSMTDWQNTVAKLANDPTTDWSKVDPNQIAQDWFQRNMAGSSNPEMTKLVYSKLQGSMESNIRGLMDAKRAGMNAQIEEQKKQSLAQADTYIRSKLLAPGADLSGGLILDTYSSMSALVGRDAAQEYIGNALHTYAVAGGDLNKLNAGLNTIDNRDGSPTKGLSFAMIGGKSGLGVNQALSAIQQMHVKEQEIAQANADKANANVNNTILDQAELLAETGQPLPGNITSKLVDWASRPDTDEGRKANIILLRSSIKMQEQRMGSQIAQQALDGTGTANEAPGPLLEKGLTEAETQALSKGVQNDPATTEAFFKANPSANGKQFKDYYGRSPLGGIDANGVLTPELSSAIRQIRYYDKGKTGENKYLLDRIMDSETQKFARGVSDMLESGVTPTEAINRARQVMDNSKNLGRLGPVLSDPANVDATIKEVNVLFSDPNNSAFAFWRDTSASAQDQIAKMAAEMYPSVAAKYADSSSNIGAISKEISSKLLNRFLKVDGDGMTLMGTRYNQSIVPKPNGKGLEKVEKAMTVGAYNENSYERALKWGMSNKIVPSHIKDTLNDLDKVTYVSDGVNTDILYPVVHKQSDYKALGVLPTPFDSYTEQAVDYTSPIRVADLVSSYNKSMLSVTGNEKSKQVSAGSLLMPNYSFKSTNKWEDTPGSAEYKLKQITAEARAKLEDYTQKQRLASQAVLSIQPPMSVPAKEGKSTVDMSKVQVPDFAARPSKSKQMNFKPDLLSGIQPGTGGIPLPSLPPLSTPTGMVQDIYIPVPQAPMPAKVKDKVKK